MLNAQKQFFYIDGKQNFRAFVSDLSIKMCQDEFLEFRGMRGVKKRNRQAFFSSINL